MENDRERPYSVLTIYEVKEKMKKQIDDISEIFSVSRSDTTVLLMYLGWDSVRVSERLSDDKEKLLTESGLKSVPIDMDADADLSDTGSNSSDGNNCFKPCRCEFSDDVEADLADLEELYTSPCGFCLKPFDESDLISTPICSHKFCTTCWRVHLVKSMNEYQTEIYCPNQNCPAAAGPETIEKLPVWVRDMYERYLLLTYLQGRSKELKLCPAEDCNYSIEFHGGYENIDKWSLNVVCLCGFTFCWKCKIEAHRPVTCNNASDWLDKELTTFSESSSLSWIESNTKPCPNCHSPVFLDDTQPTVITRFYVTCTCSATFCWRCLRLEEAHTYIAPCVAAKKTSDYNVTDVSCLERWEACKVSMEIAKTNIKGFEEEIEKKPGAMKEEDIKTVREGLMLILQCRQFLKWTCVYDHLHTGYEISKKEYLRFLQQNASEAVESYLNVLQEETQRIFKAEEERILSGEEEISCEELRSFRHRISTATSDIGNYFYRFIKTLKDGLIDVKVNSYDGVAGLLWFCDRCTYGNKWIHKACQMCCEPFTASPMKVEELSPAASLMKVEELSEDHMKLD